MAWPGVATFLKRAVRLAVPYVDRAVRLGRSMQRIRRTIGAAIAGVSAEQLEQVVEAERGARRQTEAIVGGNLDERIAPDRVPEAITRQSRRYAWRIRYNYVDPATGSQIQRYYTLSVDDELSPSEALEMAREDIEGRYDVGTSNLAIVRVTQGGAQAFQ